MAKRKTKKNPSSSAKEKAQITYEFEGETFLWDGMNYINFKTGIIAPTGAHYNLDPIRLKEDAK